MPSRYPLWGKTRHYTETYTHVLTKVSRGLTGCLYPPANFETDIYDSFRFICIIVRLLFKEILSVICPFLFSFSGSCFLQSIIHIFKIFLFAFRLPFFLFDILLLSDSGKVFFNSSWNLAPRKVLNWCFSSCLLSYEDRLFLLSSIGLSISAIFWLLFSFV